jgi:hypothetical protein
MRQVGGLNSNTTLRFELDIVKQRETIYKKMDSNADTKKESQEKELEFLLQQWIDDVFTAHLDCKEGFTEDRISKDLEKVIELRKRSCLGCGAELQVSQRKCKQCDKYYTSKKESGLAPIGGNKRKGEVVEIFQTEISITKKKQIRKKRKRT